MKIVKLFKDEDWVGVEVFVTESRSFCTINWSKAPEGAEAGISVAFSRKLGLMLRVTLIYSLLIQFFSTSTTAQAAE